MVTTVYSGKRTLSVSTGCHLTSRFIRTLQSVILFDESTRVFDFVWNSPRAAHRRMSARVFPMSAWIRCCVFRDRADRHRHRLGCCRFADTPAISGDTFAFGGDVTRSVRDDGRQLSLALSRDSRSCRFNEWMTEVKRDSLRDRRSGVNSCTIDYIGLFLLGLWSRVCLLSFVLFN